MRKARAITPFVAGLFRAAQLLLRLLWFVLIPALGAAVLAREALPFLATAGLWFGAALFVLLVFLARYWALHLPGGRYLTSLDPAQAQLFARKDLPLFSKAKELERYLSKPQVERRVLAQLSGADAELYRAELGALSTGLEARDGAEVQRAATALSSVVSPELSRRDRVGYLAFAALTLAALGLALLSRHSLVQIYHVEGQSMVPSLEPGQYVLANRLAYADLFRAPSRVPRRGDLVLASLRSGGQTTTVIKRVIGLPGDRVEMLGGTVLINGWQVPQCDAGWFSDPGFGNDWIQGRIRVEYLGDTAYPTLQRLGGPQMNGAYLVKPGEVFVLGDHRNHSMDSRFLVDGNPAGVGLSLIEGRVSRSLARVRPDGRLDLMSFFKRPGTELKISAVDVTRIQSGIEQCLKQRPSVSEPPGRAETEVSKLVTQ